MKILIKKINGKTNYRIGYITIQTPSTYVPDLILNSVILCIMYVKMQLNLVLNKNVLFYKSNQSLSTTIGIQYIYIHLNSILIPWFVLNEPATGNEITLPSSAATFKYAARRHPILNNKNKKHNKSYIYKGHYFSLLYICIVLVK